MTTATVDSIDLDTALRKDRLFIASKLGLSPSPEQRAVLECTSRERLIAGGERSGKSEIGADDLCGSVVALGAKLCWLYGADYDETSQEYQYCLRNASLLGIMSSGRKQHNPGEITLATDTIIKTISGKDLTKIGREAPDYILVCEAAKIEWMAYLRLRARLAERRGHMLMTGTFESSLGWYPELYNTWQLPGSDGRSFSMPTWSNLAVFPGGRDDPEILRLERVLPPDVFNERFAGIPCPPQGLVFKEFRVTHHVKEIEVNYSQPVYLWVDPGYAGAYAVEVVQIIGDRIYVVDEVYEQSRTTREVIQMCKLRPWWMQVSKQGVMDIAGKQHQANESVAEIWASSASDGAGISMSMQPVPIKAGVERYRDFLKINPLDNQPSVIISPRCKGLISEHGGQANPFTGQKGVYCYKVDKDGRVTSEEPEDKYNHAIKAMVYGIVNRFGYATIGNKYHSHSIV